MDIKNIHSVYFIGIGGIGMSALARYFHAMGKKVAGYDRVPTALTSELNAMGMDICYEDKVTLIPAAFLNKDMVLVVRTPAVPESNLQLKYFTDNGYHVFKRSEVLGAIVNENKSIAISGTHGKTTVSAMAAFLLHTSHTGCNAFLGGISKNFGSNLVINASSEYMVTEADEFDRSFHRLFPYISLVTSIDADHLDIYENYSEVVRAFETFVNQTKEGGIIIKKKTVNIHITSAASMFTYSLDDPSADYHAKNIKLRDDRYVFDIRTPAGILEDMSLNHIGITNVENAVAAVAVAIQAGVTFDEIRVNLPKFSGIQRRFDVQYQGNNKLFIDDYAHHPREIEAFLYSVRSLYPDKKLTGIFQPHLFTRTRDFAEEFGESLSVLDDLILLDIYPAREKPLKGVTSDLILQHAKVDNKRICSKNDCVDLLKIEEIDILLTMGAGDIDQLVEPIKKKFIDEEKA